MMAQPPPRCSLGRASEADLRQIEPGLALPEGFAARHRPGRLWPRRHARARRGAAADTAGRDGQRQQRRRSCVTRPSGPAAHDGSAYKSRMEKAEGRGRAGAHRLRQGESETGWRELRRIPARPKKRAGASCDVRPSCSPCEQSKSGEADFGLATTHRAPTMPVPAIGIGPSWPVPAAGTVLTPFRRGHLLGIREIGQKMKAIRGYRCR